MRLELLRCPELIAVECWVAETEINVGILTPNPRQPPVVSPGVSPEITLYDTSTTPPTPYSVSLPAIPADRPSYRITLPRTV
jgi:hypothetical protein